MTSIKMPPQAEIARKGLREASALKSALTGDIYVRKWTSVRGKGKNKREVDHELRVNAGSALLATAAAGTLAVGGAVALWLLQLRMKPVTYNYGRWAWPDGSVASAFMPEKKRGVPPTRRVDLGTKTVYDHRGIPHTVKDYRDDEATWVFLGTTDGYGLGERAGLLEGYSGSLSAAKDFLEMPLKTRLALGQLPRVLWDKVVNPFNKQD